VNDTGGLQLLIKNHGLKQVLLGLDDLYPLGDMESEIQSSYPGKILDLAIEEGIINETERDEIWDDNVLQWIFGDDEKGKQELVKKILS